MLRKKNLRVVDEYKTALSELCAIREPGLRGQPSALKKAQTAFVSAHRGKRTLDDCGVWVYYPWDRTLVHCLDRALHEELRTARNKYLITEREQELFRDFPIAIAGLSVGSHAALTIALQGGGSYDMRLADPDSIAPSNLNRIRSGVRFIGTNKAVAVAQDVYAMNPYAGLRIFSDGVTALNMRRFLTKPKRAGVLIEEMDNLALKFSIRILARRLRIPVISAADNGDGVVLEVERYDQDPSLPLFGGRLHGIDRAAIARATLPEAASIIGRIVGKGVVTPRMNASVKAIGHSLYSWPQLGGAATLAGVVLAYAARMIATGLPLKSGRTVFSLEKLLSFGKIQ